MLLLIVVAEYWNKFKVLFLLEARPHFLLFDLVHVLHWHEVKLLTASWIEIFAGFMARPSKLGEKIHSVS